MGHTALKLPLVPSVHSSVTLSCCFHQENDVDFCYVVGQPLTPAALVRLSPLLPESVLRLLQHNGPWTAVSSHPVLLGALISDWHVVIALPDHG